VFTKHHDGAVMARRQSIFPYCRVGRELLAAEYGARDRIRSLGNGSEALSTGEFINRMVLRRWEHVDGCSQCQLAEREAA
jgi:hypothetical protein